MIPQFLISPESLCYLENLEVLVLHSNKNLTQLPESIANLKNLKYAYWFANSLKNLPRSFGSLKNLEGLYLNNNKLEKLPAEITSLNIFII